MIYLGSFSKILAPGLRLGWMAAGRWQGREHFVVLETGFGLGHHFLATWQAWRDDPRFIFTLPLDWE